MNLNLIQRLRTCSLEDNPDIARELAQTGTDEAVKELIYIADGNKIYRNINGTLFSSIVSFFKPQKYGLNEQLIAIDALGEIRNQKALDFLNELLVNEDASNLPETNFIGSNEHFYNGREFIYAKGELRKHLDTFVEYKGTIVQSATESSFYPDDDDHPDAFSEAKFKEGYQRIESAIEKLNLSLRNH